MYGFPNSFVMSQELAERDERGGVLILPVQKTAESVSQYNAFSQRGEHVLVQIEAGVGRGEHRRHDVPSPKDILVLDQRP